jgi:tetratricopeptide (TPR) repeat protein
MNAAAQTAHLARLRTAAALHANQPQCLFDLANALLAAGELAEAIGCYRQAVALRPDFAEAFNNLGVALRRSGAIDEAITAFGKALEAHLDYADAHNNLGIALCDKRDWNAAVACFRRAVTLRPDFADACGNLGNAQLGRGDVDSAIACLRRAVQLRPDSFGMHNNLANALLENGDFTAAMAECRQSLALKPDYAEAHLSLSLMLLLQGDWEHGWPEYEWRWLSKEHRSPTANFSQPRWQGEELGGRHILLHSEQALGDTLQMARYVPLVAARGGKVILACQPELAQLMRGIQDVDAVYHRRAALPNFDLHCPLLSLPGVFKTTPQTVPANVPYIRAAPELVEKWRKRLEAESGKKVGLVWAGRPDHSRDRQRSIRLEQLADLAMGGVCLISLQKGEAAWHARPPKMRLIDYTDELVDWSETAALVANLDLVITVDTAVAHLAGAMGKPVWVLMQFVPDWRWMLNRADSPWYPTMRLLRQKALADWRSPITHAAEALRSL